MADKTVIEKLPGEIRKIALEDATFKGTGASITPTYVNFFFGNNGTGKSTIAKSILSGTGVTYAPGRTKEDYIPLVFNQAYIDANVASYHNLKGVFTINEINVQIQEQIDEITAKQDAARKLSTDASTEINKRVEQRNALLKQLYKDCWDKTEDLRTEFEDTQEGKKKSKQFTEEGQRHEPVAHDVAELRRMYASVYSDTARRYDEFNTVSDSEALENIPGSEILDVVIANVAQTDFAQFLEEIGATEWFRQAHEIYHEAAGNRCPYCSRDLPDGFEKKLEESFDDRYEKNLQKLNDFLQAYKNAANALYVPLTQVPQDLYPAIDIKPYNDKLAVLKAVIASNIELIKSKIEEPAKQITLEDTSVVFQELSDIITGFNNLIKKNNEIVAAGPKKKNECKNAVFEYFAFLLRDVLAGYSRSDSLLVSEMKTQEGIIGAQNKIVEDAGEEIKKLRTKTVETETAIKNINTMLRDAGFQGFEVRPKKERVVRDDGTVEMVVPNPAINYEVVRMDTGKVAENLSEGEKNFIAFLYFQQRVFGNETAEGDTRAKIVVIDDPVTSMDSSSLFIIGEQVRKMVEICRNNADSRNQVVPGNFIKQIFVLTHNAYFHREVTYPHADRYEFVTFYLVRKSDNKSSIRKCEKPDPDCPTQMMNINPVKNSYAALWEEYKEAVSSIPLMNVIRRILEYYFLQLCGYDGGHLRKVILEEHKDDFTHDDDGNEDYTKYDMAATMLSYIAASSYGVNDGLHYVDDFMDLEQCRKTFEMIFNCMEQSQHFKMMMNTK